MSNTEEHLRQLREDALNMTRQEFLREYGSENLHVWDTLGKNDTLYDATLYDRTQLLNEEK